MTNRLGWAGGMLAAALACAPARASEFPEGIQYILQGQTQFQYRSNPFRAADGASRRRANTIWLNSVEGAAIVPLASERTRLELAGSYGRARYDRDRGLDHRPSHATARLPWQAGDLLVGSFEYQRDKSQYQWLGRTWPDGDVVRTAYRRAEVGLRVTESLTLPVVALGHEDESYGHAENQVFDRRADWWSVSARYQGYRRSYVALGGRWTDGRYLHRTSEQISLLGSRFRQREVFLNAAWDLSDKSLVSARLSWRPRDYSDVDGRDTNLWSAEIGAGWDYSAKTRFDLLLWRQSYPSTRDENVLYSAYTGTKATMRWRASEKTFVSFSAAYELQDNTLPAGETVRRAQRAARLGSRLEWNVDRGLMVALDAWREHVLGRQGYSGYTDNVVRLSLVIRYGNRIGTPERLLWVPECSPPRYVEAAACAP